jgi:hypothetical protein
MPTFTNKQRISWNITLCILLFLEIIIYNISVFYDVTQACERLKPNLFLNDNNSLAISLMASNETLWAGAQKHAEG